MSKKNIIYAHEVEVLHSDIQNDLLPSAGGGGLSLGNFALDVGL